MATDTDRDYLDSVIAQSKLRLARIMELEDALQRIADATAVDDAKRLRFWAESALQTDERERGS